MKSIIFDMDGTLSDTAKATAGAVEQVCIKNGLNPVPLERIYEAMGLADLEFYAHLYPGMTCEMLKKIGDEIEEIEESTIRKLGSDMLFKGVYGMLEALQKNGNDLYIASTGGDDHVEATLSASGVKMFFKKIYCGRPEKISMVKEIVSGSPTDNWIMIGDMYKDSEAAKTAGITALGAGFGYLKEKDRPLFAAVLDKPMDVFKYI